MVAEFQPDIAVKTQRLTIAMDAVAVGAVGRQRGIGVAMIVGIAIGDLAAQRVEAAAVDADFRAGRIAAGRGHRIDRPAQRRPAVTQRIAAAIDLDMLEDLRVQFLEIAIIVGAIDRHAILQQRQPAHMIAARQARPADRYPHLLPETRLRIDAGREGERIAQRDGEFVFERFRGNDIDATGGALHAGSGGFDGGTGGDDDGALVGVFGEGGNGGQSKNEGAQRQAAHGVDVTHGTTF